MKRFKVFIFVMITVFLVFQIAFATSEQRFIDNLDGTVTDKMLGLMWAKTDNQGDINWKQARQWAKYTFGYTVGGGYENWRLPTIEELKTLYVRDENFKAIKTECGMYVKTIPQINLTCGWVWSSDRSGISSKVFSFVKGYPFSDLRMKKKAYRVLPVRNIR